jgi:putative SOS response-associated peptidase YedK
VAGSRAIPRAIAVIVAERALFIEQRTAQRARWGLVNRWARDSKRAAQGINAKAKTIDKPLLS